MKKIIITLILVVFAMSCDDNDDHHVVNYNRDIDATSEFFSVDAAQWSFDPDTGAWFFTYNTTFINNDVLDYGAVLVYVAELRSEANRWRALPRTEVYYNTNPEEGEIGKFNYSIEWGYWIGPGYLELELYHSNPDEFFPDFQADIKLVVLDQIQEETLRNNNVDLQNYQDVKNALNL